VIEQAKGMVAARENLNMPAAFSTLRSYARLHNLRLVDVATSVVAGSLRPSALRSTPQEDGDG
jgi:AmiR/NasT family two-component response regulator